VVTVKTAERELSPTELIDPIVHCITVAGEEGVLIWKLTGRGLISPTAPPPEYESGPLQFTKWLMKGCPPSEPGV
jgi:hypothetical protein